MNDDRRFPRYVLGVLVVVYVLNFLDRQILAILAERIKADLGATDVQMGFLYGKMALPDSLADSLVLRLPYEASSCGRNC